MDFFMLTMKLLFILLLFTPDVAGNPMEKKLINDLFKVGQYDRLVRPVIDSRYPVNVTFQLAFFQLIDINEKTQSVELAVWVRQKWNDYQLAWDPKQYGGIDSINVDPKIVWCPDIVHINNVLDDNSYGGNIDTMRISVLDDNIYGGNIDTMRTRVNVYSSGLLAWYAPVYMKGSCHIVVKDFPFDKQHCTMKFSSWSYDMSKLDLLTPISTADTSNYMPSTEWSLKETKAVRNEAFYPCCANPYPDITYHFYFERRSLFYALNLVFPIAVITLLTTLVFLLPEGSGERIGLAVTLMLAVTVFMLLVAETTPATSEHIPLITVYFILCMISMAMIMILLCIVSRLYHRELTDGPMGTWLRKVVLDNLSFFLGIRYRDDKVCEINIRNNQIKTRVIANECNSNDSIQHKPENRNHSIGAANGTVNGTANGTANEDRVIKSNPNKSLLSGNEETVYKAEWRIVAMTIDRCLLILFLSLFVISTISCFAGTKFVR